MRARYSGRVRDAMRALAVCAAVALGPGCDRAPDWRDAYDAWQYPQPLPDFALIDQQGRGFRLHRYAESWVLVGFVYTRCPKAEACPMTVAKMRAIRDAWPAEAGELSLVCFTLDPAYDTPERLSAFAAAHGADWTFATGPEGLMAEGLPSMFGVLALPDPHGGIDHTVKVALLEPGLVMRDEWKDNEVTPEQVLASARR